MSTVNLQKKKKMKDIQITACDANQLHNKAGSSELLLSFHVTYKQSRSKYQKS